MLRGRFEGLISSVTGEESKLIHNTCLDGKTALGTHDQGVATAGDRSCLSFACRAMLAPVGTHGGSPSVLHWHFAKQQLGQKHGSSQRDAVGGRQQSSNEGGDGHILQEAPQHVCRREVDQLHNDLQRLGPHLHTPSSGFQLTSLRTNKLIPLQCLSCSHEHLGSETQDTWGDQGPSQICHKKMGHGGMPHKRKIE